MLVTADVRTEAVSNGHHATPSTGATPTPASSPTAPTLLVNSLHGSLTPSPEPQFKKNQNEYSSFRVMKNKVN